MADEDLSTHWEETEGQTAKETAAATAQHFWPDADGAHVSSTGDHDLSGLNLLLTATKLAFRNALSELMTISENLIELGKNSTSAVIKFCGGKGVARYENSTAYFEAEDGGMVALASRSAEFPLVPSQNPGVYASSVGGVPNLILCGEELNLNNDLVGVPFARFATAIQPVVLYNGGAALTYDVAPGAGTTGTVTLSETAANFKEMTVFFRGGANKSAVEPDASVVEANPNGAYVLLPCFKVAQASPFVIQALTKTVLVSGTTITTEEAGYMNFGADTGGGPIDIIYITRVEGRR